MEYLILIAALWCALAGLGAYIAGQKNRAPIEGAAFGFLLGPIGLLIEVLLPTLDPSVAQERSAVDREWDARNEEINRRQREMIKGAWSRIMRRK